MNNEEYLKSIYNKYESVKYFKIQNNSLVLNYHEYYKIPLQYVKLSNINENIFFLNPIETFQIIYMLELINKPNLNDNEIKYITDYTKKYLTLNDKSINNSEENAMRIWCLSIPIYTSYDPNNINLPGSNIIQELINTENKEQLNGKGKKLVLINKATGQIDDTDFINEPNNFGFVTSLLVVIVVIVTVAFLTFFILHDLNL